MKQARAGKKFRNLWTLTVLSLLREQPRHPYEMQRLIRERHNDSFLELKPGSLYHAIERLLQAGLIAERETTREGRRPERTVYELTAAGEQELLDWLREMLARPARETPEFYAALSLWAHLATDDARDQLRLRAQELSQSLIAHSALLKSVSKQVPRVFLIEGEYMLTMRRAELAWVQSILEQLDSGQLAWDFSSLIKGFQAPDGEPETTDS
jgi:DNA-binding PadR family transcriptional regulator